MFNIKQLTKAPCWNFNQEVNQFCQPLKNRFNITYFDYSRFYPDQTCLVYFSDRSYVEYFTPEENFQSPVTFLKPGKYLWQTYIPDTFLQVAQEQFDYTHGLTVYRQQNDYVELINFAGSKKQSSLLNLYLNHFELLEAFVTMFCDVFTPSILKHRKSPIILPDHDISNKTTVGITKEDIVKYSQDILNQHKVRQNQKVLLYNNQLYCLSIRECVCLQYLLKAHSHKEIAQKMNISLRTATVYCQNVYQKLGVKNHISLLYLFSQNQSLLVSE